MSEIEDVEFYGRAVRTGEMSLAEAAVGLAARRGAGLSAVGAEYLISAWIPVREQYESLLEQALRNVSGTRNSPAAAPPRGSGVEH
ncbi:hypothetical protein ACFQ78_41415 [Streptomyces sp. NPDC056519]|uniref:hypothetical protein n=1 Tax=Streptomyces sp. NPDC056519 TaxID=3345849 RepID=UPI00369ECACC